jgi:hypothetical protein
MNLKIGDIFWMSVTYPRTGETEVRPVVIYAFVDDNPLLATFATITRSEILDFDGKYDKWKVPLFKYYEYGLDRSYVKANCIATVDKDDLKQLKYIGNMDRMDLKNVVKKVNEFLESDDEAW